MTSLPIATCGARRASSASFDDVALAVRQLALGELHLHVLRARRSRCSTRRRRGAPGRSSSSRAIRPAPACRRRRARAAAAWLPACALREVERRRLHAERLEHARAASPRRTPRRARASGTRRGPPMKPAGGGQRIRVLEQLAELARRLHRRRAPPSRSSGVTPSNSSSHSKSWRGMPVHAQMRCLTSTWLVVSASPSLNDGRTLRRRRVPRRASSRRRAWRASASSSPWCSTRSCTACRRRPSSGLPSSRTPKPPANTTLPSWTRPTETPGTPSELHRRLDELRRARRCARRRAGSPCLPANDSRVAALRQQLPEDQPDLRAALLADRLRHVVDRDRPHVVGAAHVGADVALLVRRRLILDSLRVGPAVLVGARASSTLQRPLRVGLVRGPRGRDGGVRVRVLRRHVDEHDRTSRPRAPRGSSRPRTRSDQPAGATNVLPATVVSRRVGREPLGKRGRRREREGHRNAQDQARKQSATGCHDASREARESVGELAPASAEHAMMTKRLVGTAVRRILVGLPRIRVLQPRVGGV